MYLNIGLLVLILSRNYDIIYAGNFETRMTGEGIYEILSDCIKHFKLVSKRLDIVRGHKA
jgi:hypothetical protein